MEEFGPILKPVMIIVGSGIIIQLLLHFLSAGVNAKLFGYRLKKVEEVSDKTKSSMYEHIEKNTEEHNAFDKRILVVETKGEN